MDTQELNDSEMDVQMDESSSDQNSDRLSDMENTAISIRDVHNANEAEKECVGHSLNSIDAEVCGCIPQKDLYHVGGCFLLVLVALGITGIYILYQGKSYKFMYHN